MADRKQRQVTITKAELAFLNAIIEDRKEAESGKSQSVTIYVDEEHADLIWKAIAKAGKWAWKNRWKLVALAQAATELVGLSPEIREQAITSRSAKKLQSKLDDEYSLEDLIKLRDTVLRESRQQLREFDIDDQNKFDA